MVYEKVMILTDIGQRDENVNNNHWTQYTIRLEQYYNNIVTTHRCVLTLLIQIDIVHV